MARSNTIKVLRTTRANLDIKAGTASLIAGEPYLITDEGVLAIGLTTSTYAVCAQTVAGAWTPVRNGFTEALGAGAIAVAGTYTKVGRLVTARATITPSGGATIAATAASSYLSGLPFVPAATWPGLWSDLSTEVSSGGLVARAAGLIVTTAWAASSDTRVFSATYET